MSPAPSRDLVLLVEQAPRPAGAIRSLLCNAGFDVAEAGSVCAGLQRAESRPLPAVAIVDFLLPDGTGVDLIRGLRRFTEIPVIVLSTICDEGAKVNALAAGADDYLTKPVGGRELVARIAAQLRRTPPQRTATPLVAGELTLDPGRRTARLGGDDLALTPLEWRLLQTLMSNPGHVLTHEHLMATIWGRGTSADVRVLRTTVARLRAKMKPGARDAIVTEPGLGYRFVA